MHSCINSSELAETNKKTTANHEWFFLTGSKMYMDAHCNGTEVMEAIHPNKTTVEETTYYTKITNCTGDIQSDNWCKLEIEDIGACCFYLHLNNVPEDGNQTVEEEAKLL